MTVQELMRYYSDLLIIQYAGKSKNVDTVQAFSFPLLLPQTSKQQITFSLVSVSGGFELVYGSTTFGPFDWDATAEEIQSAINYVTGFDDVTVSGSIASQSLIINLIGIDLPADTFAVSDNSLEDGDSKPVGTTVTTIDETLPLAVNNAFNMFGNQLAAGVNLDTLAKYIGVRRQYTTPQGVINLSDEDLLILMQIATIKNSSGSSLYAIQNLLYQFFPNQLTVTDYGEMNLYYYIAPEILSPDLFNMFLYQDLLPRPMAVGIYIITYAQTYFGFSELGSVTVSDLELSDGDELGLSDGDILGVSSLAPPPENILGFGELLSGDVYQVTTEDDDSLVTDTGDSLQAAIDVSGDPEVVGGAPISELIEV